MKVASHLLLLLASLQLVTCSPDMRERRFAMAEAVDLMHIEQDCSESITLSEVLSAIPNIDPEFSAAEVFDLRTSKLNDTTSEKLKAATIINHNGIKYTQYIINSIPSSQYNWIVVCNEEMDVVVLCGVHQEAMQKMLYSSCEDAQVAVILSDSNFVVNRLERVAPIQFTEPI